jgi:hypothetical protein
MKCNLRRNTSSGSAIKTSIAFAFPDSFVSMRDQPTIAAVTQERSVVAEASPYLKISRIPVLTLEKTRAGDLHRSV